MKKKILMLIIMMLLTMPSFNVFAASKVNVYIFYGDGCSHCHNLLQYISELENDPEINYMFKVNKYEVWSDSYNREIMGKVAYGFGDNANAVPYYIIGDKSFAGFSKEAYGEKIKTQIKRCYENDIEDYTQKYLKEKTTTTKRYTTKETTQTTTKRYITTYKGDYQQTTTFNILTTQNINEVTTTKKIETSTELPKDKNGNLPQDVINKFIDLLNKKDEKALDYLSENAMKNFTEGKMKDKLIKETDISVRFNEEYTVYENEYLEEEYIEQRTYIFTARFEGRMGGFKVDKNTTDIGKIHVVFENGEYKIDNMDYEIELGIGDIFNALGIMSDMLKEEMGASGGFVIPLIIIIMLLSFMPYIIFIIVFVVIVRAIVKNARKNKELREQGVIPPHNNGQGY